MRRNVRQQFDHALKAFGIRRSNRSKDNDTCDRYETLLTAYADGELDDKRRQVVEGHLNACADCRASLAATRLSSRTIFECPRAPFTGDMSARLRIAIAEESRKPLRIPIWTMPRLATAGAAFAAVALAAAFFGMEHGPATVAVNQGHSRAITASSNSVVAVKPVDHPAVPKQVASSNVGESANIGQPVVVSPVPRVQHDVPVTVAPKPQMMASANTAKRPSVFVKQSKPVEQLAELPHSAPAAIAPTIKIDQPTEMAKLPPASSDANPIVPPAAPVAPAAVRAPDNTVASNPVEPTYLQAAVDIEPVDQPSLATRLRHSARMTATTGTERVSVSGVRYAASTDGTAVLVGSGFYSH